MILLASKEGGAGDIVIYQEREMRWWMVVDGR